MSILEKLFNKLTENRAASNPNTNHLILYAIIVGGLVIIALISLLLTSYWNGIGSCGSKILPESKFSCYTYYAVANNNVSICGQLNGNFAYECMTAVAMNHSEIPACESINSSAFESACISNISIASMNASACMILQEPYKSQCSYAIAKKENFGNLSICAEIANSSYKEICNSIYYYKKAENTRNFSYCNKLSSIPNYTILSMMNSSVLGLENSEYTYFNLTPYGDCYASIAYITQNSSLCERLTGINRYICYKKFASKTNNLTNTSNICSSVPSYAKADCLYSLKINESISTKNASLCLTINNSEFAYTCIFDIVGKYGNTTYCNYIPNSTIRSSCYLSLANTT